MSSARNPHPNDTVNRAILENTQAGRRGTATCICCEWTGDADEFVYGIPQIDPLQPAEFWCMACAEANVVLERSIAR